MATAFIFYSKEDVTATMSRTLPVLAHILPRSSHTNRYRQIVTGLAAEPGQKKPRRIDALGNKNPEILLVKVAPFSADIVISQAVVWNVSSQG